MNKQQFLDKLKSKISILNDEEIDDIINEYAGYIDEKVAEGKTEKDAVKELGSVNEIATDLLDAYKVKATSNEDKNVIEKVVAWITDFVDVIISNVKGKSFGDILNFGVKLALIFLIILLGKIPFIFIERAGAGIFSRLGNVGDYLAYIWNTIIEFSYLFIAIVAFVTIIKREFMKNEINEEISAKKKTPTKKETKNIKEKSNDLKKEKVITVEPPKKGFISKFCNFCVACIILFIKFIAGCILLGMAGYIIGTTIGIVVTTLVFIKTLKFIGVIIILIGLLSIGIALSEVLFNFVVNRKTNFKKIFISIIFSLVALGGGIGLSSMQLANMSFKKYEDNATKEVIYKMDKSLIIEDFAEEDFIIDKDEKDIKVVYKYNDKLVKLRTEGSKKINLYDFEYIGDNKKIYNDIINALKKDVVYYDYNGISAKIYVNEKNFNILKDNYNKYMEEQIVFEDDECDCDCDCDFE